MTVDAECQNCRTIIEVDYVRLGSAAWCDSCLRFTVPQIRIGARMGPSGRSLTFTDFQQLLEYSDYRAEVAPLLEDWFEYQLVGSRGETLVLNSRGEAIDQLWLHLKIQSSDAMQARLYNVAMALWR